MELFEFVFIFYKWFPLCAWVIPGTFSPRHGTTVRPSQLEINWYQLHVKRQQRGEESERQRGESWAMSSHSSAQPRVASSLFPASVDLRPHKIPISLLHGSWGGYAHAHTQTHTTHPHTPRTVSVNSTCCNAALDKCLDFPLGPCNRVPPKKLAMTVCKKRVWSSVALVGTALTQSSATWSRTTCLQLVQI